MIALLPPEPPPTDNKALNLASRIKTFSFSYNHVALGLIAIRNATQDDVPVIREKMYVPLHVHTGKAFKLFDPCSKESYARVGGIFDLPSERDLYDLIARGFMVMATCMKNEEEEIMAVVSGYGIDVFHDLRDALSTDYGNDGMIRIDCFPSLDDIATFDKRPIFIDKEALAEVLDDAGSKNGAILVVRDVVVDPEYREMGIPEFIMCKVVRILKSFYNCSYFFSEVYDIDRIVVNGTTLLDKDNGPAGMHDIESKIERKEIMKGVEVGYREPFMKRVEAGSRKKKGRPVRETIDVEIKAVQWISSCERILNSVPPSNRWYAVIPVQVEA